MRPHNADLKPAVCLKFLDDCPAIHLCSFTQLISLVNDKTPCYSTPAAENNGSAGLEARYMRRIKTAPSLTGSGFFVSCMARSSMGGLCGRGQPLPVPHIRSSNLHQSAHPRLEARGRVQTHMRNAIMTTTSNAALAVCNTPIREHNGLYSLNDLHKASGGAEKHKPALFLRHDQTKALIAEMAKGTDSYLFLNSTKGRHGSTYACRELVIAYAAWISPAFNLKVINVFLNTVASAQPVQPMRTLMFSVPQSEQGGSRWLLDVDRDGNERARLLSADTHVLPHEQLVRILASNPVDLQLSHEEQLAIVSACLRNLHQSAATSAQRLGIRPASAPKIRTTQVASIGAPTASMTLLKAQA